MTINNATTSEVISINQQAGVDYVPVSKQTFDVIKAGVYYSQLGMVALISQSALSLNYGKLDLKMLMFQIVMKLHKA